MTPLDSTKNRNIDVALFNAGQGRHLAVFLGGSVVEASSFYHNDISFSASGFRLKITLEPDALHREAQRRLSTNANAHNQPLVLERGYTNLGQLDHLTLRSPEATSQQSYQYDALGRMSFRSLQGDPAEKVIAYSHDAAGRLIGSQHGDNAHRDSVDAAGNRLEQQQDKQQGLTDNRLTQLNGARYRYDGLLGRGASAKPCATPPPPPTTAGTTTASYGKKPRTSAPRWSTSRAVLCPCCTLTTPNRAKC